jgi:hypothetical protein
MIRASDWKPLDRHALRGFITLALEPSDLVLRDCTCYRQGEREWIGLPGRVQTDREGQSRRDPNGELAYTPIVAIPDRKARERFQAAALAAVYAMIGESG